MNPAANLELWSEGAARAFAIETGVAIHTDPATCRDHAEDFGRLAKGNATAVAYPRDATEVASALGWATRHRLSVTVKGRGLSQSGQSLPSTLGGLVLDCSRLDRMHSIEPGQNSIRVEAGARWREVIAVTRAGGSMPNVLPLNLDLSVGGTLSAGGIGSNSHRLGPVVANVLELEAATPDGALQRCSPEENPDLFHALLAGLGRCGVITEATLKLRSARNLMRAHHLLYERMDLWLADLQGLSTHPGCHHLEGFCWATAKGVKNTAGGSRPFAHWMFGLQIGVEIDSSDAPPPDLLKELHPSRLLHSDEQGAAGFARRYQGRFDQMHRSGAWNQAHPWLETLLPLPAVSRVLPEALDRLPLSLGDGHRLLMVAPQENAPFFVTPEPKNHSACFAVLPQGVPPADLPAVLAALSSVEELLLGAGGKRYLSGWLGPMENEKWQAHYGARHSEWVKAKQRHDPAGILRSALFP